MRVTIDDNKRGNYCLRGDTFAMHFNGRKAVSWSTRRVRDNRDVRVSNLHLSGENEFDIRRFKNRKMNQSGETRMK